MEDELLDSYIMFAHYTKQVDNLYEWMIPTETEQQLPRIRA